MRDKTILIIGASSGLGHGLARHWAGGGNRFVVTARRKTELEALAALVRAEGSACIVAPADATEADACLGVLEAARDAFGSVDVAVLNAGGGRALSMADATVEQVVQMHRVNYLTLVHFLLPLIEAMKARPRDDARTIECGRAHHMFPKRIRLLMALARLLPEPLRRAIFRRVS